MATIAKRIDPAPLNLKEQVVAINRVTKVVKGGKNLSFSALVVIGDPAAKVVGYGVGKAKEVPSAIRKGIEAAKTIGKLVAERAKEKGITRVVFDRGGYQYHGRVKALADAAREAGLEF